MTPKLITENFYMEVWTLERVRSEVKKFIRRKRISRDLRFAAHEVLLDLAIVEGEQMDYSAFGKSQPDANRIAEKALQAGIKWTAILWQSGLTKGHSSWGDPVWKTIFQLNKRHHWKPSRTIKAAMARQETSGRECLHDFEYYQKHFRRMVKTHQRA